MTGWVLDSMRMFPQKQPPTGIFEVNLLFGSMSDGMIHCSVERVVCGCLYLVRAGWGCLTMRWAAGSQRLVSPSQLLGDSRQRCIFSLETAARLPG